MGWYIGPEEHPFGGDLDVVFYGDERDANLDPKQEILSTDLFQTDDYIFNQHGHGNITDLPFSDNSKV